MRREKQTSAGLGHTARNNVPCMDSWLRLLEPGPVWVTQDRDTSRRGLRTFCGRVRLARFASAFGRGPVLSTRYGRSRQSVGGYNETPSPIGDPGLVKLGFAPLCITQVRH